MGKIVILDENTSNKIAAGEVIERPASVIKELVENSIDAGAGSVTVEIKNGGISYIKVSDNGSGIEEDDAEIAFERHATSKIRNANDLESIATLGFRGEALASIAAVSTVELTTRTQKNSQGTYIRIQGGTTQEVRSTGCPVGTTFVIRDLFYNTPARFKFLKKDSTEAGYISDVINRIALGNPQVSFHLMSNHSTVIHTPGNNDLLSTIFSIYGKETAKEVCEINYQDNKVRISGSAGKPEIARSNRNHQSIYINGRYIKSKVVTSAIDEAYKTYLLKNKFPFMVMNIEINPLLVDVNVHPTKMEVRFSDDQEMFRCVYHAVNNALLGMSLVRTVELDSKRENPFKLEGNIASKPNYTQEKFDFNRHVVRETPQKQQDGKSSLYIKNNFSLPEDTHVKESAKPNAVVQPRENIKSAAGKEPPDTVAERVNSVENMQQEPPGVLKERSIDAFGQQAVKPAVDENESGLNIFHGVKIIGQAFSTYILLQHNDELLLIDQHAAHERIMYEKIKTKYSNNENMTQILLAPVVVELTHQELKILEEASEFLNKLGFIYENFGNNSIILRSVPYLEENDGVKELFLEVLDTLMNNGKSDYRLIEDDTLYTIACKAAVKANKKMDDREIDGILKGLSEIGNPFTCPHGRPTVIRITKHELEKKFKRIL